MPEKTAKALVLALAAGLAALALSGCAATGAPSGSGSSSDGSGSSSPAVQAATGVPADASPDVQAAAGASADTSPDVQAGADASPMPASSADPKNEFGYASGTVDVENRTYRNDSLDFAYAFAPEFTVTEGGFKNEECHAKAEDRGMDWSFTYVMSGANEGILNDYINSFYDELISHDDGMDYRFEKMDVRGKRTTVIVGTDDADESTTATIWAFVQQGGHVGIVAVAAPSYDLARGLIAGLLAATQLP